MSVEAQYLDKFSRPITTMSDVEFILAMTQTKVTAPVTGMFMEGDNAVLTVDVPGIDKCSVYASRTEVVHTRVEQHTAIYIQQQLFQLLGHMPKIKFSAGSGLDQVITVGGNKTVYARELRAIVALADKTGANFWVDSIAGKSKIFFQVSALAKIVA